MITDEDRRAGWTESHLDRYRHYHIAISVRNCAEIRDLHHEAQMLRKLLAVHEK